jgi:tetratricopeptide (TPR) repeat protein
LKLSILLILLMTGVMAYSQDYRQEADKCLAEGDYKCAIKNLQLYQEETGTDVSRQIQDAETCMKTRVLADDAFEEKNYEKAERQYEKILKLNPKDRHAKRQYDLCVAHKTTPNYADDGIARKTLSGLTPTPTPTTRTQPTQQRRAFSYSNMSGDDPLLYEKYINGKRQMGWGAFFLIMGAGAGTVGALYIENSQVHDEAVEAFVYGGLLVAGGIPLMIIGSKNKRSAKKEYRRRYSDASGKDAPYFQLNAHQNGLGLAYVF